MMKCNNCPAQGHTVKDTLCFCSGHATTKIKPNDECKYGIKDYDEYLRNLKQEEKSCNVGAEELERLLKLRQEGQEDRNYHKKNT